MQRGNLVVYDLNGKVWYESGEASGDILPHEYPNGLPYLELPYGTMETHRIVSVDVSKSPHEPILEEITRQPTPEEIIADLENQLLIAEGVI